MTPKLPKPRETPNRMLARLDWATAATEARRQRDAEVKEERTERKRRRRQERAWPPPQETRRILMPVLNARALNVLDPAKAAQLAAPDGRPLGEPRQAWLGLPGVSPAAADRCHAAYDYELSSDGRIRKGSISP